MDPSAPSADWSDEKTAMNQQPPPPPYPGEFYQGYPPPGPGMSAPQPMGYAGQPGYGGQPGYEGAKYGQQPYPQNQYGPMNPSTVVVQPTMYVAQAPLANPVNDHLCYSIFTMLCCCLPLGIAALIYSINTREANNLGDRMAAERSSRTARTLNHVALGLGLGCFILTLVYVVVVFHLTGGR
ncbi:interferon-induced transmembrane protein 3-like isoform X2 [Synchiropus splendidus]|uniref:interferon-induced transmembrane protein 3-like isoform X2 n=1 Tax=Synchiropus splendidus TaxID=270530 RepID=UPI00237DD262|nr:interferon-induced transmembrane protein 3-like isoform X2 [Synchiropus splendidus]